MACPDASAFAVPPPAIPGVGTSGGITFMLEDRAGKDIRFLAEHTETFLAAARRRPEFSAVNTSFNPGVPQLFADVDQDKVLRQGVPLTALYRTLQAFLGGYFVNNFRPKTFVFPISRKFGSFAPTIAFRTSGALAPRGPS